MNRINPLDAGVAEAAFSGTLAGEDVTSQHTPMMQQCLRTKRDHPDTPFFIWDASGWV